MGFAVDDLIDMPSPVETGQIEFHEWRDWPDPFTTLAIRARESDAIAAYITAQVERLRNATRQLGEGDHALVVGHGKRLVWYSERPRLGGTPQPVSNAVPIPRGTLAPGAGCWRTTIPSRSGGSGDVDSPADCRIAFASRKRMPTTLGIPT